VIDKSSSTTASKGYRDHPGYEVRIEALSARLRVMFAGEAIVDTEEAYVLHESRHEPVYYFKKSDLRDDVLIPTDHKTHCPFKGDACYWSLKIAKDVSENAVWGYPEPLPEVPELADLVAFYQDRVESWWLDEKEIFVA
jgi:uncharacterized protein (DUF427 family)